MPEINIFVCDWCGERHEDQKLPPTAKGWTLSLDPETLIRHGASRNVESIYLYPKDMRMFKECDDDRSHIECILCPKCILALQDAVKNAREIQISKRETE
jgi:hypothetical protein